MESIADLFVYRPPEVPVSKIHTIRSYKESDRSRVFVLAAGMAPCSGIDAPFKDLPGDCLVGAYLDANPSFCFVIEEEEELIGYAAAVKDAKEFLSSLQSYAADILTKYPQSCDTMSDKCKVCLC